MADLIDRDALLKDMGLTDAVKYGNAAVQVIGLIEEFVKEMPTIETEQRHGRWIRNATSDGYHCSNCGHHADGPIGEMIDPRDYECYLDKYCGGCGARMDGGE